MGGGLMQLVAYGAQDIYLTGNPQITFFKVVYRKHTNFSMECIKQSFKGTVASGARVVATLARNGDLIHDCFLKNRALSTGGEGSGINTGHQVINNIEVEIGGQLIDKHHGHWMETHAELTEGPGSYIGPRSGSAWGKGGENSLTKWIPGNFQLLSCAGGVQTNGAFDAGTILFTPLRFWFCRHVGLSLPLIALQYHEVNINLTLSGQWDKYFDDTSLWCNYIYLDTDERRRFAQVSHEYLIEQVQVQTFTQSITDDIFKLNFNHPVKELIWNCTGGNAWGTNTSVELNSLTGVAPSDGSYQLKLNGHDRFEKIETEYFTRYHKFKYHPKSVMTNSTGSCDHIAVYSFALKPEEHQPSGTCNFSRIDNAQLISIKGTATSNLNVYAVNYNVLRIMSGMGGLAYSN